MIWTMRERQRQTDNNLLWRGHPIVRVSCDMKMSS